MAEKRAGIRQIAEQAEVSTATVSRVLNGNDRVNPDIAARVMEVAEALGYQPSPAARYMRSRKSGLIGIVVPDLSVDYFSTMVNGIIDKAREYNQLVVVGTVKGRVETEREYLKKVSGYMLDGLIHCPVSDAPLEDEQAFLKMPLIVAGRRQVISGVPHISTNEKMAGYLASRYLLNLNRKDIGFFAGFWGTPPFKTSGDMIEAVDSPLSGSYSALDRLSGYRKALKEEDAILDDEKIIFCDFTADGGYRAAGELAGRLKDFDALMVPNCLVARGVFRFLEEQGLSIPDDVSLIAMDDMGVGELPAVPLTAIRHNMYRVGEEAVIQLNSLLSGDTVENSTIDVKLQIRQSTSRKN